MYKLINFLITLILFATVYAGNIDTIEVTSKSMHKHVKCVVITPTSYQTSKSVYPVIYLLHGYGGNYSQWIRTAPQLKEKVDEMQVIIVCADGGFNSWYFNSEVDTTKKYETFIANELIEFVDKNYRTFAGRECRAISGLSMGGHGALFIALKHKEIFGACGATSGGVDLLPFKTRWELQKVLGDTISNKNKWIKNSVIHMVDDIKNNDFKIIFDCGYDDFFIDVNRNLHTKLLKLNISHDYIERPGGHNSIYWKNSIDYQLLFFKKYFEMNR